MPDYWAEYCERSTTTHPNNPNEDTVPVRYDERGYGHWFTRQLMVHLFCSNSYGPGDGFIYWIGSASGTSRLRRLGLTHNSDAWKEYMLTHYELKQPDRKPRRPQKVIYCR